MAELVESTCDKSAHSRDGDVFEFTQAAALTRRGLLAGMGFMAVGFATSGWTGAAAATAVESFDPDITQVGSWIAIGEDESVTLFSSRIDNGHGTMTGFLQIMAEELDVDFARTRAIYGDTLLTPDDGGTGACDGIQLHGAKVRQVAASARVGLMKLAAERFKVPLSRLTVESGVVKVVGDPAKRISYGKLIGGKRLAFKVDGTVTPKSPDLYKIVGQRIPRIDLVEKITGEAEWVSDIRLPGMLHARAVRTAGWSLVADEILDVDESSVAGMPGLVKVVRVDLPGMQNHFVGVICEREEQAIAAAEKLKVVWADPPALPPDLHADLINRVDTVELSGSNGDVDAVLKSSGKVVDATYKTPSVLHSPMLPAVSVADVKVVDGKVESARLWVSCQRVGIVRQAAGKALGIPEAEIAKRVRVSFVHGAGTFGTGNGNTINAIDAVMLSKAVGRPVRLQWTRQQQNGFDFAWPVQMFNLKAALDDNNAIAAYSYEHVGDHKYLEPTYTGSPTADGSIYKFAQGSSNYRLLTRAGKSHFPSNYIRGNAGFAVFPVETMVDELAAAAKEDPLAFRRRNLDFDHVDGYRRRELLDILAQRFGWDARPSPHRMNIADRTGVVRGRGMAYSEAEFANSNCGGMVEVEVDQTSGQVKVLRVVVVMDAGLIINPLLAQDQVEGSVIMGVGRALFEERKNDSHRTALMDFTNYPIIRFDNVPQVEAILLNRKNVRSGAYSDTALDPLYAAIGNAIFDATGARVRQMPFSPERVLEALRNRPAIA